MRAVCKETATVGAVQTLQQLNTQAEDGNISNFKE